MLGNLKRQWHAFRHSRPGSRFQDRYERNRRVRKAGQWYLRFLKIGCAVVLIAIGVVLTVIPGPAVLFFMFGAGLLADESRPLARLLDWTEIKTRRVLTAFKSWWKKASVLARSAAIVLASCMTTGALYLFYRIVMRG